MNLNTVSFPSTASRASPSRSFALDPGSSLSIHLNTALEICDLVYGSSAPSWQSIERFYDPSATYENPFVTATSRGAISDIHALSNNLAKVNVPRPAAVLYRLLGLPIEGWDPELFQAISTWHEITDVCESESFDSHRKAIVEHTLHIVILPGLHGLNRQTAQTAETPPRQFSFSSDLSLSGPTRPRQQSVFSLPSNMNFSIWPQSPLHLRFPVITRLSFNDAGSITYHRDFWDVKDVLGLIPGMTLAQWICTRMMAQSIRAIVNAGRFFLRPDTSNSTRTPALVRSSSSDDIGISAAAAYENSIKTNLWRDGGGESVSKSNGL